jgi:hypothetical protein
MELVITEKKIVTKSIDVFVVPNNVTCIEDGSFVDCNNLIAVFVKEEVKIAVTSFHKGCQIIRLENILPITILTYLSDNKLPKVGKLL